MDGDPAPNLWDLSLGHPTEAVHWPTADQDRDLLCLQAAPGHAVPMRLLLPQGKQVEAAVTEAFAAREPHAAVLSSVRLHFPPETLTAAFARAMSVSSVLGLDDRPIRRWKELAENGSLDVGGTHGPLSSSEVAIEVRQSFRSELPWYVSVGVSWPPSPGATGNEPSPVKAP